MPNRHMNIQPSGTSQQNMYHGLHAPTTIIDNKVEMPMVNLTINDTPDIPRQANNEMYMIAQDTIDNFKIILVDDQPRICNVLASPNPEWDYTATQAFLANGITPESIAEGQNIPSNVDLRESWWADKDQGQTGACAGFAASSLVEYVFTKTNRLKAGETIAPRPIWMSAKETDGFVNTATSFIEQEGTSLSAVLNVLQRWGCVKEVFMPFQSLYTKTSQSYYLSAAGLRIASYFNVGKNPDTWRKWLSLYGPIYCAINVDSSWQNATQTKGYLDRFNSSQMFGGHAVVICGYDVEKKTFLFKNSWGTNWGDRGYAHATESWCMQAVIETYGISV